MKRNRDGLDEMQRSIRDRIGSQSFMLMAFLLMIDMVLNGFGIKWLSYPSNALIIIDVCMIQFLVRVIRANAYTPPETHSRKPAWRNALMVVAVVLLAAVFALAMSRSPLPAAEGAKDHSALILAGISIGGLIVVGLVFWIQRSLGGNPED